MNPLRSRATMGSLPSRRTNAMAASKVSAEVVEAADHLDQRHERHRIEEVQADEPVGATVAAAGSVMERLEVLEAKIVAGGQRPSSSARARA